MTAVFFSVANVITVVWRETAVNTSFRKIRSIYAFMQTTRWKEKKFLQHFWRLM